MYLRAEFDFFVPEIVENGSGKHWEYVAPRLILKII